MFAPRVHVSEKNSPKNTGKSVGVYAYNLIIQIIIKKITSWNIACKPNAVVLATISMFNACDILFLIIIAPEIVVVKKESL